MSFSLIEIDPVYHVYSGQFSSFPEEIAVHGLSCRRGGVSEAPWASLNLGLHVGDDPAAVIANRRRYLAALGLDASQLVTPGRCTARQLRASAAGRLAAARSRMRTPSRRRTP